MKLAPKIFGEEVVICSAICVLLKAEGLGVGVQIEVSKSANKQQLKKSPTSPLLMA